MPIVGAKIKGLNCFTQEFCGFDEFRTINVIIGRNNTGKSQLVKLIGILCADERRNTNETITYEFRATLDEPTVKRALGRVKIHSGSLAEETYKIWSTYAPRLIGSQAKWRESSSRFIAPKDFTLGPADPSEERAPYSLPDEIKIAIKDTLLTIESPYKSKAFRQLSADRDIQDEVSSGELGLQPGGAGATNIIRSHLINASNIMNNRALIQDDLRKALNEIFGQDGNFVAISVHQHNDSRWEIFLEEKDKGLIPLSSSGSGLKTVILVLLNLIVIPALTGRNKSEFVFAFEELENNLHPALLRRLLSFIERFSREHKCTIFLTTHSSVTLDHFARSESAQFVRVSHNGNHATTQTITAHLDRSLVVGELGARASDILQANGIIWVEGPSDAIYINHWIHLISEGSIIEGRDYACAFYGGSLLARLTLEDPTRPNPEDLIRLLALNRNAAIVCDSDKSSEDSELKLRVLQAKEQVDALPYGFIWITDGKEIENYLPGSVIASSLNIQSAPDPGKFELLFPSRAADKINSSYIEKHLNRSSIDKVELALASRSHTTAEAMSSRFDWEDKMKTLIDVIRKWNE
ncbi:AAA family ATPase [Stenotrophomonas sp. 6O]|uniref:AAA family ATPase n=1 Tax=Stenotrophomonas sp. 6O TaxID=3448170 RepID=UPI003EDFC2AE